MLISDAKGRNCWPMRLPDCCKHPEEFALFMRDFHDLTAQRIEIHVAERHGSPVSPELGLFGWHWPGIPQAERMHITHTSSNGQTPFKIHHPDLVYPTTS